MIRPIIKRISKDKYEILVTGNRDYRSPDNEITVEVTKKDELIITVPNYQRCYAVNRVETMPGWTKIFAN